MNRPMPLVAVLLGCLSTPAYAVDCQNTIPPSNPDAVYQGDGNGTVTDTRSGLMWKRCSEGQTWVDGTCSGSASDHTWAQALARAEASSFAGHADWRLPSIKELSALVEECRVLPAINNTVFPDAPSSAFWSSSPLADGSGSFASHVGFDYGDAGHGIRSIALRVRLVRGGQ